MKKLIFQAPLRGEGRYVRQNGGLHRYGHVVLLLEHALTGLSFSWEVSEKQIPAIFKEAIYRGVRCSFWPGEKFENYIPDGLLVRIVDGSSHENDSNEGSFEIASALAISMALASEDVGPITVAS